MYSHKNVCLKSGFSYYFEVNHFPCVCQVGKSRLISGHENSEHFRIIQICNISVSSVEITKKLEIHSGKGNYGLLSTYWAYWKFFRVLLLLIRFVFTSKIWAWKNKLLLVLRGYSDAKIPTIFEIFVIFGALFLLTGKFAFLQIISCGITPVRVVSPDWE